MQAIYEPKGRALEYSPLAVNLYRGCSVHIMASGELPFTAPFVPDTKGGATTARASRHFFGIITMFSRTRMARQVVTGALGIIKPEKHSPASAFAGNHIVRLLRFTPIARFSMKELVHRKCHHFKILRTVVGLVAVDVVNKLRTAESAAKHLLRHQPMLVTVARNVGVRMIGAFDADIPVRTDSHLCHIAPPYIVAAIIAVVHKKGNK